MAFTPPPLDSEVNEFTPPPLESEVKFTPPPLPEADEYEYFKQNYKPITASGVVGVIPNAISDMASVAGEGISKYGSELVDKPLETIARTPSTVAGSFSRGIGDLVNLGIRGMQALGQEANESSRSDEENMQAKYRAYKLGKFLDKYREENVAIPGEIKETAEAGSLIADPIPFAGGLGASLAKGVVKDVTKEIGSKITSKTLEGVSKGADVLGDIALKPSQKISDIASGAKGTAFDGLAQGANALGQIKVAPLTATGGVLKGVSGVTDIGRAIAEEAPVKSQISVLDRVANNTTLSPLARKTALFMKNAGIGTATQHASDLAKGATLGAGIGAGISGVTANSNEEVASGLVGGAASGAVGYKLGKILDRKNITKQAEAADVQRFKDGHQGDLSGVNPDVIKSAANLELLGGGTTKISFRPEADIKQDGLNARGYATQNPDGTTTVTINQDRVNSGDGTVEHEFGHALYNSPVVDKGSVKALINTVYSEDSLLAQKIKYAEDSVKSEGIKEPNEAQIASKVEELDKTAGDDWIYNEIFANQVLDNTAGKTVTELQKTGGNTQGLPLNYIREKSLQAKQQVLGALGFESKGDGSGDLKNTQTSDPRVKELVTGYVKDLSDFKAGLSKVGEAKDVALSEKEAKVHIATRDRIAETAQELKAEGNQNPTTKDIDKRLAQKERAKKKVVVNLNTIVPNVTDYNQFGRHPDGWVGGKKGLAEVMEKTEVFSDADIDAARKVEEAIQNNGVIETWYRGNIKSNSPVRLRQFAPWDTKISKAGQVLVNSIDLESMKAHVQNLLLANKLELFNNNAGTFWDDFSTLSQNHANGRIGSQGIGDAKYQYFRKLLGFKDAYGTLPEGITGRFIKTPRIDNMANPKVINDGSWKGFDYYKTKTNQLPLVIPDRPNKQ